MPNLPLPPSDNYLGDGDRTTGEFQAQINNLQNWVRALQSELDALTSTTVREGAVRSVGTGLSDLVQTSQLNTRLGTTGILGSAALKDVGESTGDLPLYTQTDIELGGQFSAGELVRLIRIGNFVCISGLDTLYHSLGTTIFSATGVIPLSERPVSNLANVSYLDDFSRLTMTVSVSDSGSFYIVYEDLDDASTSSRTSTPRIPIICYNV